MTTTPQGPTNRLQDLARSTAYAATQAADAWKEAAYAVKAVEACDTAARTPGADAKHWTEQFDAWAPEAEERELNAWTLTETARGLALATNQRAELDTERFRLNSAQASAAQTLQALARLTGDLGPTYPAENYRQAAEQAETYRTLLAALQAAAKVLLLPW